MKNYSKSLLIGMLCLFVVNSTWAATETKPSVNIWRYETLLAKRAEIKNGSKTYEAAYKKLVADANWAMKQKPHSVMDKTKLAVSGDKHDYVSIGRYYHPDPTKPNGLPYISKDGVVSPDYPLYDAEPKSQMCSMVTSLGLAYFFTGETKYADKAVEFVRVWFLDPATKMNPHLEFGQITPGRNGDRGRATGIIDSYMFIGMLNALELAKGTEKYTPEFEAGLKQWFNEFLKWMVTSDIGIAEERTTNNHSIAYDQQVLAFAQFVGLKELPAKIIREFPEKRLFAQIEPDGKMPRELGRTLAIHYTEYNLKHILEICVMAEKINPDLYNVTSQDGRSISKAIEFTSTFLGMKQADCPYQQIADWDENQQKLCWLLRSATQFDKSKNYMQLFDRYVSADRDKVFMLLY